MRFRTVTINNQLRTDLILYSETGLEDYLFNHVLTLVDNTLVPTDTINFARLSQLPDKCLVSDRYAQCVTESRSTEYRLKPKFI